MPLAYCLLAVVVFCWTLWASLPYDDLARSLERELAAKGIGVKIGMIEPLSLLSYEVRGIRLLSVGNTPVELPLGVTVVSVPVGELLSGNLVAKIDSASFGGKLVGEVTFADRVLATMAWRDVDLSYASSVLEGFDLALKGSSYGQGKFSLDPRDIKTLEVSVETTLAAVSAGPGSVSGFSISKFDVGGGPLKLELSKGRLRIIDSKLSGGDVDITLSGSAALTFPLRRTALDVNFTLEPKPAVEKEMGLVFGMLAGYKKQDGIYSARLRGTMASPYLQKR